MRSPELKGKKRTVTRLYVPAGLSIEFTEDILKKWRYPHMAESTRISDFDSNFRLLRRDSWRTTAFTLAKAPHNLKARVDSRPIYP